MSIALPLTEKKEVPQGHYIAEQIIQMGSRNAMGSMNQEQALLCLAYLKEKADLIGVLVECFDGKYVVDVPGYEPDLGLDDLGGPYDE